MLVDVNPDEFITIPGGSATYACIINSGVSGDFIESMQWLVNDTLVEDLELDNVFVTGLKRLRFTMITVEFNNTSIRCRANFTSGTIRISEEESMLLIQG